MKLVLRLLIATAVAVPGAAGASERSKNDKDELLTLYLLSVAADRCGFPISARQSDAIDRETRTLVEKLRLGSRENDAIYSEADLTFERQGPAACDRNGNFARGFRRTLQRVTAP